MMIASSTNWRRRAGIGLTTLLAAAGSAFTQAAPSAAPAQTPDRPNIVLIMCDDMGYSDLGCYGGEIATPNIDRLAEEGVRFTQFYNAARCCPTRASLLTGQYPHAAGVGAMVSDQSARRGDAYLGRLNDRCVTIAEVLKTSGYRTYLAGKWHVGENRPHWPVDRGFDHHYGLASGAMNYFDLNRPKNDSVKRIFVIDDQPHTPPNEDWYATDAFTDYALRYIVEGAGRAEPFFLYLAYTAPHWPLHALPEDIAKYRGRYVAGWTALRAERFERMQQMGLLDDRWSLSEADPAAADWDALSDEQRDRMDLKMAIYAAQIDRMDQNIGRVLDALEETGELDNTFIFFLSDNGACSETGPLGHDFWGNGVEPGGVDSYQSYGLSWSNAGNTPFRKHKQFTHEGGISTPLIVRGPDVVGAGRLTAQVGHVLDLMATCCDLAGAAYPEQFDGRPVLSTTGRSLVPVLEGAARTPHEILFWEHMGHRAVRWGDWKLVSTRGRPWELYDIARDRSEQHDLSEEHPDVVEELRQRYRAWAADLGV
jgi:arylsulfatase A-like enzyme